MRRASLLILAGLCWLFASLAAAQPKADEVLTEKYKLTKLPQTNIWALPEEIKLRDLWADLTRQRDAAVMYEQLLADRIQRNARDWIEVEKKEAGIRLVMTSLDPRNREARAQFETQIAALRKTALPPAHLAEADDVRDSLIELSGKRTNVWLTARAIRDQTPQVVAAYQKLAKDERVGDLIKKAGLNHRLGPARPYVDDLKKLPEFEKFYEQDWLPLIVFGDKLRFSVLINESRPITVTWTSGGEPALLPAALADSAGVEPDREGNGVPVAVEGKTYQARSAVIHYLRLGRYELRDVKVLVLPAEAEFAGARLGPMALAGLRVEPQPDRLRVMLSRADLETKNSTTDSH